MIPLRDDKVTRTAPLITWALVLANIAVFVYELTLDRSGLDALISRFGLVPARLWALGSFLSAGRPGAALVPLVSSMFLHGGWLHLVGNIWMLWLFGDDIEERLGHVRFLVFYLVTGILAGLLHALIQAQSTIPTIGASGAIAGVMGAYLVAYPFAWLTLVVPVFFIPLPVKMPAAVFLLLWIVSQVAAGCLGTGSGAGVAFWAHVGGFVAGLLLVRRGSRPRRRR
jgi:membrane associated rhomboid family serine protease